MSGLWKGCLDGAKRLLGKRHQDTAGSNTPREFLVNPQIAGLGEEEGPNLRGGVRGNHTGRVWIPCHLKGPTSWQREGIIYPSQTQWGIEEYLIVNPNVTSHCRNGGKSIGLAVKKTRSCGGVLATLNRGKKTNTEGSVKIEKRGEKRVSTRCKSESHRSRGIWGNAGYLGNDKETPASYGRTSGKKIGQSLGELTREPYLVQGKEWYLCPERHVKGMEGKKKRVSFMGMRRNWFHPPSRFQKESGHRISRLEKGRRGREKSSISFERSFLEDHRKKHAGAGKTCGQWVCHGEGATISWGGGS